MSNRRLQVIAVIFGGRSVEHDVSIVTGHQVMNAFPADAYRVVPVYIARDGRWYTGEPLTDLNNFKDGGALDHDGVLPCLLSPDTRHHGLIVNPLAGRFRQSEVQRDRCRFPRAARFPRRRRQPARIVGISRHSLRRLRHLGLGLNQ